MRKKLLTLLLALSMVTVSVLPTDVASAATLSDNDLTENQELDTEDSGECGTNLHWDFSGYTLTITGSGDMYDFEGPVPWNAYKNSIRNLSVADGVTSIGVHAFSDCKALTSVSLPASVTKIGFAAFSDCTSITEVRIPNGTIGESAFIRCSALQIAHIGAGVTAIGISAFENCNNLQAVFTPDIAAWCKIDFGGILANPTQKAKNLYMEGSSSPITSLNIPNGVTEIKDYAFEYCSCFQNITIPGSVTKIGDYAFYMCNGASTVNMPASGITSIGASAFDSCSNLTNVSIPATVSYLGHSAFRYVPFSTVTVNQGIIGAYAFEKCGNLNKVNLGAGVTKIGDCAFDGCNGLDPYYGGTLTYGGSKEQWNALDIGKTDGSLVKANFNATGSGAANPTPIPSGTEKGATVTFGKYEQDGNGGNGAEKLEWLVLDVNGDNVLLISKNVLSFPRYGSNFSDNSTYWASSSLRSWLNGSFYNEAFTEAEKASIATSSVPAGTNPRYGLSNGGATSDKVYILSATEATTYLATDADRMAVCTAYAKASSITPGDSALCNPLTNSTYWWLRSTGNFGYNAAYVQYSGSISYSGMATTNTIVGVRPVILVNKGAVAVSEDKVSSFVTRLYNVCLKREPDAGGKAGWVKDLKNGSKTGAQVAYGFIFSQEFQNCNYCNEDYVKQLYRAFMGREADAGGLSDWVNRLETGTTREEVFNGFSQSAEFNNLCNEYGITLGTGIDIPRFGTVPKGKCSACGKTDGVTAFVTRLYNICLDRNPDESGLNDWTNNLWAHTKSGKDVSFGFIFSQEFQNKGLNNADYVEYLYKAFFDRTADATGKSDWLNRMSTQGYSREDVFNGFVGSTEFDNLCKKYGITRD